jgi:murein DD-endopeptidase MepM/ murein hydrolase activator NlpD
MNTKSKHKEELVLIANPIYDTVFKHLMENERIAKFFIGTLLGQTVVEIDMKPQEYTYERRSDAPAVASGAYRGVGFSVFRVDFIATVKSDDGERRKVLIEVQKAWDEEDFMRFRNYLAEQYKRKDMIDGEEVILPITTIYVLGFKLPGIETACIKVGREYQDLINHVPIKERSPFVEKLTHDSYVVQVERITGRYQTPLDKLLSIFEQAHFINDDKIVKRYHHRNPEDKALYEMTEVLHFVGSDPEERKKLEIEREAWRTVNEMLQNGYKKRDKIIAEKDKTIAEKDEVIAEKDEALTRERAEKEKERAEKEKAQKELAELKRQLGKT